MHSLFAIAAMGAAVIPYTNAAPDAQKTKPYDMPVNLYQNGFNTDVLSIGTPPQKLRAFIDWTWIGPYVVSTMCHDGADIEECLHPKQAYFNETASSTFEDESDLYPPRTWNPNHFFFDQDLSVVFSSDVYRVGPAEENITIQASHFEWKTPMPYPFSNIFGMSPVYKGDNSSIQSPFYQMVEKGAYPNGISSFIYCYNKTMGYREPPKSLCNNNDGLQTLGGYHREHINWQGIEWYDNIVFPIVNEIDFIYKPPIYNYWSVPVTKHLIGDEEQPINQTAGAAAVFDHASYGRGTAMSIGSYKRLVEITDGKPVDLHPATAPNNGKQKWFSVNCDRVFSFPPIKYQFGKRRTWQIKPEHYVEKTKTKEGEEVCVLNVRTIGEGEDFVIGNLGEDFAKDKVILFDYLKLKIGVADLRYY